MLETVQPDTSSHPFEATKYAYISQCKQYRYVLSRTWAVGKRCLFVMLNPSTANATQDDPTIRKCVGFAKRWGFCALDVVNVYAFRATDPHVLKQAGYPCGEANKLYLSSYASEASRIVCAWGRHARHVDTLVAMASLDDGNCRSKYPLDGFRCLGKNKDGTPRHPLMLAYDTPVEPFI